MATQLAGLDSLLAARLDQPESLTYTPVPLLGVPGWWTANENPGFYDDPAYFRPKRQNGTGQHGEAG